MLWFARVECVSERKQAGQFVVNGRFWVAIRATLLAMEIKYSKHTIGFASVVHYGIFLYARIDESELDKFLCLGFAHCHSFYA